MPEQSSVVNHCSVQARLLLCALHRDTPKDQAKAEADAEHSSPASDWGRPPEIDSGRISSRIWPTWKRWLRRLLVKWILSYPIHWMRLGSSGKIQHVIIQVKVYIRTVQLVSSWEPHATLAALAQGTAPPGCMPHGCLSGTPYMQVLPPLLSCTELPSAPPSTWVPGLRPQLPRLQVPPALQTEIKSRNGSWRR